MISEDTISFGLFCFMELIVKTTLSIVPLCRSGRSRLRASIITVVGTVLLFGVILVRRCSSLFYRQFNLRSLIEIFGNICFNEFAISMMSYNMWLLIAVYLCVIINTAACSIPGKPALVSLSDYWWNWWHFTGHADCTFCSRAIRLNLRNRGRHMNENRPIKHLYTKVRRWLSCFRTTIILDCHETVHARNTLGVFQQSVYHCI